MSYKKNVLHPGYDGQKSVGYYENVLHPGYDGQKSVGYYEKCPSSRL
ncbi:hypothetical protein [Neobacillus sp. PS2-9]|nr:hypothetical protein [Neobacillus sp. PS2-9]WML57421.1 hypothetical protein RCG25_21335 [Neobacillus sp. PS2-9]